MSDSRYESMVQAALSLYRSKIQALSRKSNDSAEPIAGRDDNCNQTFGECQSAQHSMAQEPLTALSETPFTEIAEIRSRPTPPTSNVHDSGNSRRPTVQTEKYSNESVRSCRSSDTAVHTEEELSSIRALEDAIMLLPQAERSAYLRAKQEAPELVQTESNPIWFMKYEKENTWNAAKRLCFYWTERLKAFKDRAMLPLNQTGEGAFTKKDVALMSSGYHAFLPTDKEGRTVIFADPTRHVKKDFRAWKRHMFYWALVTMQNKVTVELGFIMILRLDPVSIDLFQKSTRERQVLTMKAFPGKAHTMHIIPNNDRPRGMMSKVIPHVLNLFSPIKNNFWHCYDSDAEIVAALGRNGIDKENLPESIGGGWSYDNFAIWQEERIRIEWDLPSYQNPNSVAATDLTTEERKERKRRYNVLHARRKRRKDRISADAMNQQISKLKAEKEELLSEQKRLLEAHSRATLVLCCLGVS